MKKIILQTAVVLLTCTLSLSTAFAQSPQKMSYQAVIRDASNTLVTSTAVGMQISILQTTSTGTAVYVETQTPTTNANGLVSIEIGGGTVVSGTFSAIDWSAGPYFIKTETDSTGGTTYTITGTSQLLSVPYALSAGNVTGLEKITENTQTGWRLVGRNPLFYGDIGTNAVDLSFNNFETGAFGATGNNSIAMGFATTASGDYSIAMGGGTKALGNYSSAIGLNTTASRDYSIAMGNATTASGKNSTTMGFNTKAEALYSTATGYYNIGGGDPTTSVSTNPLFEVGNGTSSARSNALTIFGGTDASLASGNSGFMMLGNSTGSNVVFDTNEIMARLNGGSSSLSLQAEGGDLIINSNSYFKDNGNVGIGTSQPSSKLDVFGVIRARNNVWPTASAGVEIAYDSSLGRGYVQSYDRGTSTWKDLILGGVDVYPVLNGTINLGTSANKWKAVYAVDGTIQTSDRRMKKDINNIKDGINTLMKLRPVSYKWRKGNQDVNLGLIAQEVQKVIPEVIDVGTDKAKTLGMKYTALIPVVIKATQEQQKIIEKQQKEINELKKMVNKLLQKKILVSTN